MNNICVIPARMGSSRLPNKPLINIMGMPLIAHCYYRACLSIDKDKVYVATCDNEIYEYINNIGGKVVMTNINHNRASTRTAEAVDIIESIENLNIDNVIMIQGDEPLYPPMVLPIIFEKLAHNDVRVVNLISKIYDDSAFNDKNNVKVVTDKFGAALYFSREPIPCAWDKSILPKRYLQTGIIGFSREGLDIYNNFEETHLEIVESVDMNRLLENKVTIDTVSIDIQTVGVDTLYDIKSAEILLRDDKYFQIYNRYEN